MNKQNLEKKLVERCLSNYKGNLAAVLIFGSYNVGPFRNGSSDLDTIILLKEEDNVDFEKETKILQEQLKDLNVALHHFRTIENYRAHIYSKGSWSSWITVICGSKVAYSTPDFERFRKELAKKPIQNAKLIAYVQSKDGTDLSLDLEKTSEWVRTKAIFSHIKRKLQILNYNTGNKLEFDYSRCLEKLKDLKDAKELKKLSELYEKREGLGLDEAKKYVLIARNLTKDVLNALEKG